MTLLSRYFLSMLNLPYIWGGQDPFNGFDCSGLIQFCLQAVGLDPKGDQTAQALFTHFMSNGHSLQEPAEGALIFYGTSPNHITHVAYCLDSRTIIEAGGGNQGTKKKADAIKQSACVRLRPWKYRKDYIGIIMPKY